MDYLPRLHQHEITLDLIYFSFRSFDAFERWENAVAECYEEKGLKAASKRIQKKMEAKQINGFSDEFVAFLLDFKLDCLN